MKTYLARLISGNKREWITFTANGITMRSKPRESWHAFVNRWVEANPNGGKLTRYKEAFRQSELAMEIVDLKMEKA